MQNRLEINKEDICGYDEFNDFSDIQVCLPNDLIEEIKELSQYYHQYSNDGTFAFVLREGLRHLK